MTQYTHSLATVTLATGKRGVVYFVHTKELKRKRRELGQPVQLSSAREAEKNWHNS
jgi:hypothetical protein